MATTFIDEPNRSSTPLRLAVYSIIAFWLFHFVLVTVRAALFDFEDQLAMIGRRTVVTSAAMAMSFGLYFLLRSIARTAFLKRVALIMLASIPCAAMFAAINYTAFYVYEPLGWVDEAKEMRGTPRDMFIDAVIDGTFSWYFFFVAWAALYMALSYAREVRSAERQAAAFRAEAQSAQLRALRYQINPHFLFNTLNSISSLVLKDRREEAERMIMNLSNFFRTSLATDPTADVPLAEEVRMQQLYLEIEKVRFPDRLKVRFDIPEQLDHVRVPGLILQPIIENAIKYGVARANRPVTLTVTARALDGLLQIMVEDDGDAAVEDSDHGTGVGLRNVCDRLAARYGGAGECTYGAGPDGGFRVELKLPRQDDAMPGHD